MGDVINFRQARKAQVRKQAAATADQNRARHGRTKAEKQRDKTESDRLTRTLEGARREDGED